MSSPRSAPHAATAARESIGCYVLAVLRPSRGNRRVDRSKCDRKAAGAQPVLIAPPSSEGTILNRLPSRDLASLAGVGSPASASPVVFGRWDYEAQLRELQRLHERCMMSTSSGLPLLLDDPLATVWLACSSPCPDCEAATAADMREPPFHWCVRDPVTVGFRSSVGRPSKRSPPLRRLRSAPDATCRPSSLPA